MARNNVKINLTVVKPIHFEIPNTVCRPMLVAHKDTGVKSVIVRYPGGSLFFDGTDGSITYCGDEWLKDCYSLVRYLDSEESVTFTGQVD